MLFDPHKLLLIAGPCSLESKALSMEVASELSLLRAEHPEVNLVFKGSFDKANRTSLKSERGPGLSSGLEILAEVKSRTGFATLTDVHQPDQIEQVASVCDVLQIPAFLCRQTDLLVEAARSGRVVNVKKGQFLSPYEMAFVVDKLTQAGAKEIWLTDRGNSFGYQNLVVDMRSIPIMQGYGAHPVLLDATHCVQLPGAAGGKSGGQREFVPVLANAALAAGANGLFVETHPRPEQALSDSDSQLRLSDMPRLLRHWIKLWQLAKEA